MKRRCPICANETDSVTHADFPFCSERCRLLDLGNWASEKYRISTPIFDESQFENINPELPEHKHDPDHKASGSKTADRQTEDDQ